LPFLFDQQHTLNFALSYAYEGWRFGARLQLATGRPYRPVVGSAFDADENDYDAVRGGLTGRLPTFHQLDLRVDREFRLGRHLSGSVYLDVLNAYNAANTEGIVYQYDFARRAQLGGLPILPTLGVRLEYQ
jgi:hypothetical protein